MNILPLKRSGELAFVNSVRVEHRAERAASSATDIYLSPHGNDHDVLSLSANTAAGCIGRVGLGARLCADAKIYDQPWHLSGVRLILLFTDNSAEGPLVLDVVESSAKVFGRESYLTNWDLTELTTCELAMGEMILA
jgi:hypothetical protein